LVARTRESHRSLAPANLAQRNRDYALCGEMRIERNLFSLY